MVTRFLAALALAAVLLATLVAPAAAHGGTHHRGVHAVDRSCTFVYTEIRHRRGPAFQAAHRAYELQTAAGDERLHQELDKLVRCGNGALDLFVTYFPGGSSSAEQAYVFNLIDEWYG